MVVKLSKDVARLNEILNDPEVYPWVHGTIVGPIDATSVVNNKNATILLGEHGGMVFYKVQAGLYDFHTFVLKSGRGEWSLKMAEAAFHYMYTKTDAMELLGRVPYGNIAAKAFAKRLRGVFEYRVDRGWIFDHQIVPADIYSFKVQDWMRDAGSLVEIGEWFHGRLEKEYFLMGHEASPHPEDKLHDRYVGATVEMIRGGQPFKAAVLYNRWAVMAGYLPIQVVTDKPSPVLDIREAILLFKDNDFKVIACHSG